VPSSWLFRWSVGHFWTTDEGDFKRVLGRSVETGLVRRDFTSGSDPDEDPTYRLTMQGKVVLDEWLVSPEERYPLREPFLLRLFFAGRLEPAIIGRLIDNHIDATSSTWPSCRRSPPTSGQQFCLDELPFEDRLRLSTLDRGIAFAETELMWAEGLRADLDGDTDPDHELAKSP
jgi:DNA-binding PadR family transcriptional regulator